MDTKKRIFSAWRKVWRVVATEAVDNDDAAVDVVTIIKTSANGAAVSISQPNTSKNRND